MKNLEIAKILYEIADILELQDIAFKPRAYRRAARRIEELSEDVGDVWKRGELEDIPGVGKNIASKIEEILKTGHLKYFEELKKKMPFDIEGITAIEGMGIKKAYELYKKLGVKNIDELEKAAQEGKIRKISGFGETSEKRIFVGIQSLKKMSKRMLLGDAILITKNLERKLRKIKTIEKIEVVGSIRRRKETIGDLDILVISKKPLDVMEGFTSLNEVDRILGKGKTKSSVELESGLHVDLRVVPEECFGSAMQYFTGSKYHNIATRKIAQKKRMKLSEYGLFEGKKRIAGKTERDVYQALGMQYVPPEIRENNGEIEAAAQKRLPKLISRVYGDLHCHTTWSEGRNTIEEMAAKGKKLGYEYMSISDHAGNTLKVANPLDEKRLKKQGNAIDKINKKNGIFLVKSAEVNIKKNGGVDVEDKYLKRLDIVIAAIHYSMRQPKEKIMKRLFSAMENEHIDIIAHPTGRKINSREPYALDFNELLDKAKETGTALEINAQPDRLDLDGELVKKAIDKGIMISIGSDAHHVNHMEYMELGIAMARRGWCEERNVLNCLKLKDLRKKFEF